MPLDGEVEIEITASAAGVFKRDVFGGPAYRVFEHSSEAQMAELRLLPLDEILNPPEIDKIVTQLLELGIKSLPTGDDIADLDNAIADDQMADFLDKLEAHDVAYDIYLPVEFDTQLEVGDYRFGSVYALADALEELRDELDIDGDVDEEDPQDEDEAEGRQLEYVEEQLAAAWRIFARAAAACISRQMPFQVIA